MSDSGLIVLAIIAVLWLFTARWLAASTRDDCAAPRTLPRWAAKRYGAPMENRRKDASAFRRLDDQNVPQLPSPDEARPSLRKPIAVARWK